LPSLRFLLPFSVECVFHFPFPLMPIRALALSKSLTHHKNEGAPASHMRVLPAGYIPILAMW
jgi:hypothetical protein